MSTLDMLPADKATSHSFTCGLWTAFHTCESATQPFPAVPNLHVRLEERAQLLHRERCVSLRPDGVVSCQAHLLPGP
jgi:hypothetical protein